MLVNKTDSSPCECKYMKEKVRLQRTYVMDGENGVIQAIASAILILCVLYGKLFLNRRVQRVLRRERIEKQRQFDLII